MSTTTSRSTKARNGRAQSSARAQYGLDLTHALLTRAAWGVCPACRQVRTGAFFGRVVLRGSYLVEHEEEIRRRRWPHSAPPRSALYKTV